MLGGHERFGTQAIRVYWLEYERLIESLRLDVGMKQDDS